MWRILALLGLILTSGCQPKQSAAPAVHPSALAEFRPPPLPELRASADWPAATDQPIPVTLRTWSLCRSLTPEETQAQEAEVKRRGPHARYSIVVRTNPEAIAPFRRLEPLPPGTVVVKEKHWLEPSTKRPAEYALMIKRNPGFDPEHGNWEYVYATGAPEWTITRGRLSSCIDCHAVAKDRDYLFRSYLESTP
jgi:Cytochrome P460